MKTEINQSLPLSENQRGLWHLQTLHPDLTAYNTASVFRLRSCLDIQRLQCSLQRLVAQQPLLRTTFSLQGDTPYQVIHEALQPTFNHIILPDVQEVELHARVQAAHDCPFDLSSGPLVRLTVFSRAEDDHVLLLNSHHILLDYGSHSKLAKRLFDLYAASVSSEAIGTSDLAPQNDYADFVAWQQTHINSPAATKSGHYWAQQLQSPLPVLDLPTDRPLPRQQTFNGAVYRFTLPTTLSQDLAALARSQQVTPFSLVLTAFALLLARYSRQDDLIVGVPSNERVRTGQRFQHMLGYMINLLPIRLSLADQPTFVDLVKRVQTTVLGGLWHQNYPFARMVQAAHWQRDLSRSPLLDATFNMPVLNKADDFVTLMEGTPIQPLFYKGLQLEPFDLCQQAGQSFLNLNVWSTDTGMIGFLKYNRDLFDETTIARMAGHFTLLLNAIVQHPEQPVLQLPMLTAAEYHQIVHEWNDTTVDFGEPQTIHALFEQQVARTPNAVALVFENKQLTYRELNERANQLAHHLMALGVGNPLGADTLVAVMMERSLEMVVSLLAVLKAGGAYVPIDPSYPSERIAYMLKDSAVPILLTQSHLSSPLSVDHAVKHVIHVDMIGLQLTAQPSYNPQTQTSPEHLAYVIYTSGSTGRPKGIRITECNVTNFLMAMQQQPGLMQEDRLLALTTISFDIAVLELYLPLVVGASVVMASQDDIADPDALIRLIQQHKITVAQATPVTWKMLTAHKEWSATPPIKVLCGGEALPLRLAQQLHEHSQGVWNLYGPTEATVWVSAGQLQKGLRRVTIAPPIANTTFYILDHDGYVVPIGVSGELHIGGVQLARGYLNRPELTAERFSEHPVFGRLYKTGDLCRWLPDGTIEYLGRTDFQVKIRGFRVELGEIENALLAQDGVREAVVLAREDNPGDNRLVAYIVADKEIQQDDLTSSPPLPSASSGQARLSLSDLRTSLQQKLPDYMIPSAFVPLEKMPLTPNGKVDRRALPAPEYGERRVVLVAARTLIEQELADIWSDVLGRAQVSLADNFFESGGHSLLAVQLIAKVNRHFQANLSLAQLFQFPTIYQMAHYIEQRMPKVAWSPLVALKPTGTKSPIFCVHSLGGNVNRLYPLARAMPSDQPFYGLQAVDADRKTALFTTIESMAHAYVEAMRTLQPQGPYLICGYSFGCQVAFEMARQLQLHGEAVGRLILLDTHAPIDTAREPGEALRPDGEGLDWFMKHAKFSAQLRNQSLPAALLDAQARLRKMDTKTQLQAINFYLHQADLPFLEEEPLLANFAVAKANREMVYKPPHAIDVPTLLLYTSKEQTPLQKQWEEDVTMGWGALVKQSITCQLIPGDHSSMLQKPLVQEVAMILTKCLAET